MNELRKTIIEDINNERERQEIIHPVKLNLPMRFTTLVEEVGEIATTIQNNDIGNLVDELIQTAAVCVRMIEEVLGKEG